MFIIGNLYPVSIVYICTNSVTCGLFLSLLDMWLTQSNKAAFISSIINRCWGRAELKEGNLKLTYQDVRVTEMESPGLAGSDITECHNGMVPRRAASSYRVPMFYGRRCSMTAAIGLMSSSLDRGKDGEITSILILTLCDSFKTFLPSGRESKSSWTENFTGGKKASEVFVTTTPTERKYDI